MARCDVPGCDWRGKAKGKPIHMALVHDIHPVHDGVPREELDPIDEFVRAVEEEHQGCSEHGK